jgi:hypothetical protein
LKNATRRGFLAAERQQLPGERRSHLGAFFNGLGILAQGMAWVYLFQHHAGVTHDGRENVIEVMGHAGSQPAHGVHFLGVPELFLALLQGSLGFFAGDAGLRFPQFAFNGRTEAGQLALHDVIMRSRLHRRHGRLLTDRG